MSVLSKIASYENSFLESNEKMRKKILRLTVSLELKT